MINLIQGDCLEKLKDLADNAVDSIVTDPPAGISFMGKTWDGDKGGRDHWIAWKCKIAKECLRVLKPGGHALVWALPRTAHWTTTAWENAGFEVRDVIAHLFGSGFPKGHNLGKSVDKLQGNERVEFINKKGSVTGSIVTTGTGRLKKEFIDSKGSSPYEGWWTALKPAREDYILLRKPFKGTVANNVLEWGTGGINIDGCRVGIEDNLNGGGNIDKSNYETVTLPSIPVRNRSGSENGGRFPANIIHDGSDEVLAVFPETKSGSLKKGSTVSTEHQADHKWGMKGVKRKVGFDSNSGSAARFFYCAKASKKDRNEGLDSIVSIVIEYEVWNEKNTIKQVKKVTLQVGTDKSVQKVTGVSGLENKDGIVWNTVLFGNCTMERFLEVNKSTISTTTNSITKSQILNWLVRSLTNEYTADVNCEMMDGGNPVAFANESNTLITTINEKMALALGVKNVVSETQLKISVKDGSNFHSTVKATALMQYLVRLVTPTGGTVLDPFMGSGSTGKACKLEGFNFIGVELDPEYFQIAKARIENTNKPFI